MQAHPAGGTFLLRPHKTQTHTRVTQANRASRCPLAPAPHRHPPGGVQLQQEAHLGQEVVVRHRLPFAHPGRGAGGAGCGFPGEGFVLLGPLESCHIEALIAYETVGGGAAHPKTLKRLEMRCAVAQRETWSGTVGAYRVSLAKWKWACRAPLQFRLACRCPVDGTTAPRPPPTRQCGTVEVSREPRGAVAVGHWESCGLLAGAERELLAGKALAGAFPLADPLEGGGTPRHKKSPAGMRC